MENLPAMDPLLLVQPGTDFGVSDWVVITQDMIDRFGELTMDPDPLHVDPQWATANGPFGGTISYGFLTISMLTHLFRSVVKPDISTTRQGLFLNYGFDRLRIITPVPTGSRVRGHFALAGQREAHEGRRVLTFRCSVEIEGEERPAIVCDWLSIWMPPTADGVIAPPASRKLSS